MRRILSLFVLVLLLGISAGCGDNKMATVTGVVTVDGQHPAKGHIYFVPKAGDTADAGGEIKEGKYTAAVPPGMKIVRISVPKVVGEKAIYDTPDSPKMAVTAEALPARFNDASELELDVKPGKNTKDFNLTTQ